jgi:hypothetical protein
MIFRPLQIIDNTPQAHLDIQHARNAEVARVRLVHQVCIEEEEFAELEA